MTPEKLKEFRKGYGQLNVSRKLIARIKKIAQKRGMKISRATDLTIERGLAQLEIE